LRVIDKNSPSEVDKFWFTVGEMRVTAALKRQSGEVLIEEGAAVCEALNAPDATEAGRPAYLRGLNNQLDTVIAADARAVKNGQPSLLRTLLAAYVESIPAVTFNVRPEKRTLKRKTVEAFDDEGRILSMLEETIQV
jgi:hypothetical protein